jgi:formylglycine-generating enzyme required for sulfatase activity
MGENFMAGVEKCTDAYCEIPGGTFQEASANGGLGEPSARTVTLAGFLLGQTEVSVGQYRAYLAKSAGTLQAVISGCLSGASSHTLLGPGDTIKDLAQRAFQIFSLNSCSKIEITKSIPRIPNLPENQKGDDYPVVGLIFDEKRDFCQAQGGDLPTASQLHFASRYDDQDIAADQLVIRDNGFRSAEPVDAGFRKNRFGVFNLLGNVWESVSDVYTPWSPSDFLSNRGSHLEEFLGGSWNSDRQSASTAHHVSTFRGYLPFVGFRCAKALP